jgi:hypothetical protein
MTSNPATFLIVALFLAIFLPACSGSLGDDSDTKNEADDCRLSPRYCGLVEATKAYLDSTEILLKDYYDGERPDYVAPYRLQEANEDAGMIATFRHYDGLVEIYPLNQSEAVSHFIARLQGPMPGNCHLFLLKEENGNCDLTYDFAYSDRMSSQTDRPSLEIAKFMGNQQNCILLRTTDGVVCRFSETLTVLQEIGDALQIIFDVRESSNEGPCYRGENPNDTLYYDIVRDWKLKDKDGDGINEAYVSGTILAENAPKSNALKFEEAWVWDDSLRQYEVQKETGWHVDSTGRLKAGWE